MDRVPKEGYLVAHEEDGYLRFYSRFISSPFDYFGSYGDAKMFADSQNERSKSDGLWDVFHYQFTKGEMKVSRRRSE